MIALVDSEPRFRAGVAGQLGRDDVTELDGLSQLERLMAERPGGVSVVLLGPNVPTAEALGVTERMQASAPEVSVLFIANTLSSDLLQAALRAGVRDVLPASFTPEQLRAAVERAKSLSRQSRERGGEEPEPGAGHRVITVFSSKGGVGKSFVASNLAVLLAQRHRGGVALVDLDLQFGDLAIMMQIFPARTIYDAAQNPDRLDAEALKGYLTPHRSSLHLLAAPLEPGLAETVSGDAVLRIIRLLRQMFQFVVIDSPTSFTDHVLAALDESDTCVLLTSLDVPSIKNLKLALQTLEMLGIHRDRIRLVLNRADSQVGLRVQEVERTLGTVVDISIPSSRDVPLSVNRGTPLAMEEPRSPVIQALGRLADECAGGERVVPPARGRFRLRRSRA